MTTELKADEPTHIITGHHRSLEDAIEAVRAADVLGLGCVLRNELQPGKRDGVDIHEVVWLVDVFDDAPLAPAEPG